MCALPISGCDGTFCCHLGLAVHAQAAVSWEEVLALCGMSHRARAHDGHPLDPGCPDDRCKMQQQGDSRQCNMSAKPLQFALTQQSAHCSVHGPQGQPWSNQQHSCGCQMTPLLSHQQGVSANLLQDGWRAVSPNCRAMRSASAYRGEISWSFRRWGAQSRKASLQGSAVVIVPPCMPHGMGGSPPMQRAGGDTTTSRQLHSGASEGSLATSRGLSCRP